MANRKILTDAQREAKFARSGKKTEEAIQASRDLAARAAALMIEHGLDSIEEQPEMVDRSQIDDDPDIVELEAIQGFQGKPYWSVNIPYRDLRTLKFIDPSTLPVLKRAQRILNWGRVKKLVAYILGKPESYILPGITLLIKGDIEFIKDPPYHLGNGKTVYRNRGVIRFSRHSEIFPGDGNHRIHGARDAVSKSYDIDWHTLQAMILIDLGLEHRAQVYLDINDNMVKPTAPSRISCSPELASAIVRYLCEQDSFFGLNMDYDHVSVPEKSNKLFTLCAFREACTYLLKNPTLLDMPDDEKKAIVLEYWKTVMHCMRDWELVYKAPDFDMVERRKERLSFHGITIGALGIVGIKLLEYDDWKEKLKKLSDIDFKRDAAMWQGSVLMNGCIVKTKATMSGMAWLIMDALGIAEEA